MQHAAQGIAMVCFDVDGTLVRHPEDKTVWQVLNEVFLGPGQGGADGERFRAFVEGRLEYAQWVALDVGDWQRAGLTRRALAEVIGRELAPVPGAAETLRVLRERGYRVALVSGTLDLTLEVVLGEVEVDRAFTNRIHFDPEGRISGWEATPFDMEGKARALDLLAREFDCPLTAIAFVGDHWNDLAALEKAALAIAFEPKDPRVRQAADHVIEGPDLRPLLDLFPPRAGVVGGSLDE